MRWNPYINALAASAYVWAIGFLFQYISSIRHDTPDKVTDPIMTLSLLVFSAAVMGFLFFYRPVVLLIENKKEQAISFFLKTLATFGVITLITVFAVLSV